MKNKLYLVLIAVCSGLLSSYVVAGYESTTKEERRSRSDIVDEAYLTTLQEERARIESVDDAFLTENQEELERMNADNDARTTAAAEQAEQRS